MLILPRVDRTLDSSLPNCKYLHCYLSLLIFIDRFVRHWDVYDDGKVSHIFRLDLPEVTAESPNVHPADKILRRVRRSAPISPPVDLLQGQRLNSPVPPFGCLEQFGV